MTEAEKQAILEGPSAPLAWLHDAENDLGELADIVGSLAASMGATSQARRANEIMHKWVHRRSLRGE